MNMRKKQIELHRQVVNEFTNELEKLFKVFAISNHLISMKPQNRKAVENDLLSLELDQLMWLIDFPTFLKSLEKVKTKNQFIKEIKRIENLAVLL